MGAELEFERRLLHARHVRIGTCRLDRSLNEVHDGDRCTRLMPKAAAVLEVLVHFAGQPVSKERLLLEVWRGEFPTEDVVTNAISQVRKAFGDGARDSRYIRTVPRVGYALVADVAPALESVPETGLEALETMQEQLRDALQPAAAAVASRAWLALIVVLLVLALGAGILVGGARWRAKVARPHVIVPLSAQVMPHGVTLGRDAGADRNFVASLSELRRDGMSGRWHLPTSRRIAQGEGDADADDRNGRAPSRAHLAARGRVAAYGRAADGGTGVAWTVAMAST
jgi:DNA-binding winged helix-turn-helix (wHTH) protein